MTDTIGSTPQPPRPQPGPEPTRPPRFRLPEPQQSEGPAAARPAPPSRPAASAPSPGQSSDGKPAGPRPPADAVPPTAAAPPVEGRYGARRAGMSRRRKAGLAVTGLVILGGVAGYIGWQLSHPAIQGVVTSFSASGNSVVVTFEVDKPASKTATCTLVAEDTRGSVVGSASVPILSGRAKNVQSYTLQTTTTANTVLVQSCSLTS